MVLGRGNTPEVGPVQRVTRSFVITPLSEAMDCTICTVVGGVSPLGTYKRLLRNVLSTFIETFYIVLKRDRYEYVRGERDWIDKL